MNIQKANSYMLAASTDVNKSYWFCLSMILLLCLEILLAFVVWCIFAVKRGQSSQRANLANLQPQEPAYQQFESKPNNYLSEEEQLVQNQSPVAPMNYSG